MWHHVNAGGKYWCRAINRMNLRRGEEGEDGSNGCEHSERHEFVERCTGGKVR